MVDVDRRMAGYSHALRRLSVRASTSTSTSACSSPAIRDGVLRSYLPLAHSILSHLRSAGVTILPGLTTREFSLTEAEFGFQFPPDLRAVLALGLPSALGFPDWRSPSARSRLRAFLDLPIAAVSIHITKHGFWSKSWGPRPPHPHRALQIARSSLKRSPLLIPLFDRCYLPSRSCVAGNPVFLVHDSRISFAGLDLADFFDRHSLYSPISSSSSFRWSLDYICPPIPTNGGKTPRWIQFWSDAAFTKTKRNSSSSSASSSSSSISSTHPLDSTMSSSSSSLSSTEVFVEIPKPKLAGWVATYLGLLTDVLKDGGWGQAEVDEMVYLPAEEAEVYDGYGETRVPEVVDCQTAFDHMLLNADRFSGDMHRAGWHSDEVSDMLGFDFQRGETRRRPQVKLPSEVIGRMSEIAMAVSS